MFPAKSKVNVSGESSAADFFFFLSERLVSGLFLSKDVGRKLLPWGGYGLFLCDGIFPFFLYIVKVQASEINT